MYFSSGTSSEKVLLKPRSPAPFKLGEIASQFEEEEESEDDSQQLVESDDVSCSIKFSILLKSAQGTKCGLPSSLEQFYLLHSLHNHTSLQ